MSTYADLDLDTPIRKTKAKKLKADLAMLAEDARDRMDMARERGLELANASAARAAAYAREAADHARRRPVSTGLIAAAVGIGLIFLFSRTARSTAVSIGEDLWSRYGRR
jgi:ElaB/YqjD/DUF883 family membrane-anchored ribosome-binding protein